MPRLVLVASALAIGMGGAPACARDLRVHPFDGDDARDGVVGPVRTIARAIRLAQPGDTIHLAPAVYRESAAFYDKAGEPDRPIVLDGHGATLEGCDPLDPSAWKDVAPGLYRHDDLLPLTVAIVDRWFFLQDGRLNRMNRCSKGPSEPLKSPETLQPGEWTFVKDADRSAKARPGYVHGSFFLKLKPDESLAAAKIEAPIRSAGVLMHGKCRHLVVKNVTCTHPHNDGFNLSDCQEIVFENIRAIDCGDDGISAHGACRYRVDGLVSSGNATGICDTGASETSYRHVLIRDCVGFDLFFLDTGRYSVSDALVVSTAAKALYLQGRQPLASSADAPATASAPEPCRVELNNVVLRRERTPQEVRVSARCRLKATRTTFLNLNFQATGGEIALESCLLGGTTAGSVPGAAETPRKPDMHLWKDARFEGRGNHYDFESIRVAQETFTPRTFEAFRKAVGREEDSRWEDASKAEAANYGADWRRLPTTP